MQGRQLFSYYVLLFVFLILTRALIVELNAQFDLAVFPKLASVVQQALDSASNFDNVVDTIGSLLYAFLFSLPVALVYRITKERERFDPALSQTIVLLAMVVTAVIVVISGDLARAFGLAGVVAAVRFRNTLDDAKDAVYVFCAIAIGMACGAKAFTVALWTSILMTTTLYFMWRYQFGRLPGQLVAARDLGKKARKKKKKKEKQLGQPIESSSYPNEPAAIPKQDVRLRLLAAGVRAPGDKKANGALVVTTSDPATATAELTKILGSTGGGWRLVHDAKHEGESGAIEFVGRLAKRADPSDLVQTVRGALRPGLVEHVEFRSLKGSKPNNIKDALFASSPKEGENESANAKGSDRRGDD